MPSLSPLVDSITPVVERAGETVGSLLASGIELAGELASEVGERAADLLPSRTRPGLLRRAAPWVLLALAVTAVVVAIRRRGDHDDTATA